MTFASLNIIEVLAPTIQLTLLVRRDRMGHGVRSVVDLSSALLPSKLDNSRRVTGIRASGGSYLQLTTFQILTFQPSLNSQLSSSFWPLMRLLHRVSPVPQLQLCKLQW